MDYALHGYLDKFGFALIVTRTTKGDFVARIPGLTWKGSNHREVHARVRAKTPKSALYKLIEKISYRAIGEHKIGLITFGLKEGLDWGIF